MSKRRVQIVILCEDRQQEVFARHFLEKRGFKGLFRPKICPSGSQSGEQYVRNQYHLEVKAYRQHKNRVAIGLVVLIDADPNLTVNERIAQLNESLEANLMSKRQEDESIAIFVPKRNIETWIHYLQGESVDEIQEYPKFNNNEALCKPYVADLANKCCSHDLPSNIPESLKLACVEFQRLLPLLKD